MKITPLAADSMGSRSMAVCIETRDGQILIDPGASVAPLRYGLAPHPLEQWQLQKHLDRIRLYAESSQTIVISSFHQDHFVSDRPEWLKGKTLLMKNPNRPTTPAERNAAFEYLKKARTFPRQMYDADERSFSFGKTEFVFSPACFNGQEYFIQMLIRSGDRSFLFSSNARGADTDSASAFLLSQKADVLYLDGPATYLQKNAEALKSILERMERLITATGAREIILDHHALRDLHWKKRMEPLFQFCIGGGIRIRTAAEYRGEEPALLEARRNELYQNQPQP